MTHSEGADSGCLRELTVHQPEPEGSEHIEGSATVKLYVAIPLPPHIAQKFHGIPKIHRTNVWSPQSHSLSTLMDRFHQLCTEGT